MRCECDLPLQVVITCCANKSARSLHHLGHSQHVRRTWPADLGQARSWFEHSSACAFYCLTWTFPAPLNGQMLCLNKHLRGNKNIVSMGTLILSKRPSLDAPTSRAEPKWVEVRPRWIPARSPLANVESHRSNGQSHLARRKESLGPWSHSGPDGCKSAIVVTRRLVPNRSLPRERRKCASEVPCWWPISFARQPDKMATSALLTSGHD